MTAVDELIEKGAERLEDASARLNRANGLEGRLREELVDDARFVRKLKPSAIAARAHGDEPPEDRPAAPSGPQLEPRPQTRPRRADGPSPVLVLAAAFAAGFLLAKIVDWRGHAHPRI